MGIAFASYVTVFAIFYFSISVIDLIACSLRILSIFLWKQAILSIVRSNKANIISKRSKIKWVKDDNITQVIHLTSIKRNENNKIIFHK